MAFVKLLPLNVISFLLITTQTKAGLTSPCMTYVNGTADCSEKGLDTLPPSLPQNITQLNLSNNNMGQVVANYTFAMFSNLRRISLSRNDIRQIESMAFAGTSLTFLDLRWNTLTSIPDIGENAAYLRTLLLSGNYVTYLSFEDLQPFSNLNQLAISFNKLADIEGLEALSKSLVRFYAGQNDIAELRFGFNNFSELQILELPANPLSNKFDLMFINGKISKLILNQCGFNKFPELTNMGASLQKLFLNSNSISFLNPLVLGKLIVLSTLSLNYNPLISLDGLQQVSQSLIELHAISNDIVHVADHLLDGSILEVLTMGNTIETMPTLADAASTLLYLEVSSGTITHLSDAYISRLLSLQELVLQNNLISSVTWIPLLNATLIKCSLKANNISFISRGLLNDMPHLEELDLSHNPLIAMPQFSPMHRPFHLNIVHIAMRCDSCWLWLYELTVLDDNQTTLTALHNNAPCVSGPQHLINTEWQSIELADLKVTGSGNSACTVDNQTAQGVLTAITTGSAVLHGTSSTSSAAGVTLTTDISVNSIPVAEITRTTVNHITTPIETRQSPTDAEDFIRPTHATKLTTSGQPDETSDAAFDADGLLLWSTWTSWTECSTSCGGGGTRWRFMLCESLGNATRLLSTTNLTLGYITHSGQCNTHACPVDGRWQHWQPWGACSVTCGVGTRIRSRNCDGPFHDGMPCNGKSLEVEYCSQDTCVSEAANQPLTASTMLTGADYRLSAQLTGITAILCVSLPLLLLLLLDCSTLKRDFAILMRNINFRQ